MWLPVVGRTRTRSASSPAGYLVWNARARRLKITTQSVRPGIVHRLYRPASSGWPPIRTSRLSSIVVAQFAPGIQTVSQGTILPKSVRRRYRPVVRQGDVRVGDIL
jgi:hypothetical protein